jgi:hypothetical protein
MKQVSVTLSTYTADVSGVCSALYELGGMVVIHDPSGCNSTYNTHDEPRWYDMDVRRGLNYKYFTGQDWGKAQNYDLALNRGSLGIEKCAQLIVDAASEE